MSLDEFIDLIFECESISISQNAFLKLVDHMGDLDRISFAFVIGKSQKLARERVAIKGGKVSIESQDISCAFEQYWQRLLNNPGYMEFGKCPTCKWLQELEIENPIDLVINNSCIIPMETCMNPSCGAVNPLGEFLNEMS